MPGKSSRQRIRARQIKAAKRELTSLGVSFEGSRKGVVAALREAGIAPQGAKSSLALDCVWAGKVRNSPHRILPPRAVSDFYATPEWRRLAYKCKLRDGRRCMCCGARPEDGARIVSDHIKPVRLYWHLRLDPENIQTLCDDCNKGKGSVDDTDFREVAP